MNKLQEDASKYDIQSLIRLQQKRLENINIFEQSIKNERIAIQQEDSALNLLELKIRNHDSGICKLSETERVWIFSDIPKIKSTRENREKTITLLKAAIIEEYSSMDYEGYMIAFLEKKNDGKI